MPDLGWPEVIIIVVVVLLLFGGKKLPEIARGTGRALRIFKAETKGLMDEDDEQEAGKRTQQIAGRPAEPAQPAAAQPVDEPQRDPER